MDETKQFIKMCEKAVEIRITWKPSKGDFYFDGECWERVWRSNNTKISNCIGVRIRYCGRQGQVRAGQVWLPRQDQLQDMVKNPDYTDGSFIVSDLFYRFKDFYNVPSDYPHSFKSMEQLWLAFVMETKYGKAWDNEKEDWINTTKECNAE